MIRIISEVLNVPYEGVFWWIDGKLVAFCDQVNPNDPYQMTDLLHKDVWNHIKSKYTVKGKEVSFDYFPRGRVETLVIQNNGTLDHYESNIYIDRCIKKKEIIDEIVETFRLYLPKVRYNVCGQLFIDGSHYTCFNCK